MRITTALLLMTVLFSTIAIAQPSISKDSLMQHVRTLASDEFQGRRTGEPGNQKAAQYIAERFKAYGLAHIQDSYEQPFQFYSRFLKKAHKAKNVWGMVEGQLHPDTFIVISAHYDHLGIRDGQVYNGADDNASGVGAMLELARHFGKNPSPYSLIFVAFDAEELGLKGAQHFTEAPPAPLEQIKLNVNMDMIGRNERSEIYICGTAHYPDLRPVLQPLANDQTGLIVSFGHDQAGGKPSDDWTQASDHGYFHKAGIPFIYFGVEDHKDYHQPSDDAAGIVPVFYQRVTTLILEAVRLLQESP